MLKDEIEKVIQSKDRKIKNEIKKKLFDIIIKLYLAGQL
jgi:hypothetical protein